jgi:hypothetical protein
LVSLSKAIDAVELMVPETEYDDASESDELPPPPPHAVRTMDRIRIIRLRTIPVDRFVIFLCMVAMIQSGARS